MRQPHCLRGLLLSLHLRMWLEEDGTDCVARMQRKFLRVFFYFILATTLAGLCIAPLSLVYETVSAKDENYNWPDQNLEQQLFFG